MLGERTNQVSLTGAALSRGGRPNSNFQSLLLASWPGTAFLAGACIALTTGAGAAVFVDDFANGINPLHWVIETNQPLYSVSTADGAVTFSRLVTDVASQFEYAKLSSRFGSTGRYVVQVDFRNAVLARSSGTANEVQLVCYMGGRIWYAIRSDQSGYGQTAHIYIYSPPPSGGSFGWTGWDAASGTFKVDHSTSSRMSFWLDETLLYETPTGFSLSPATFALFLVNNGSHDAISVTFDNFRLTADEIIYPPLLLSAAPVAADAIVLSWTVAPGYVLETTPDLSLTNSWRVLTNDIVVSGGTCFLTNSASPPAAFYRLRQGP